jgi:hypothetical protein
MQIYKSFNPKILINTTIEFIDHNEKSNDSLSVAGSFLRQAFPATNGRIITLKTCRTYGTTGVLIFYRNRG